MEQVNVKINGRFLRSARGFHHPGSRPLRRYRYPHPLLPEGRQPIGACRMCMVEVKGARSLVAACVYPVNEGMEVFTNTPRSRNPAG